MIAESQVIRFYWAIKTLLRDKANFDVLEGFLSAILEKRIQVEKLLESESNQEDVNNKFNRVDILVADSEGSHFVIEIQNEREADFLERLLYGTSKVIVENLDLGASYREITKVISISVLYFNLGVGNAYIYHGNTEFRALHGDEMLVVKERYEPAKKVFKFREKNIFPEYYLINVERFQDVIERDMDEWIYMLKHSSVRDDFHSYKIDRAREKLALLKMSQEERKSYERYIHGLISEKDVIETAKKEGHEEGHKEGHKEGREEGLDGGILIGKIQLVQEMRDLPVQSREELSQRSVQELEQILSDLKKEAG